MKYIGDYYYTIINFYKRQGKIAAGNADMMDHNKNIFNNKKTFWVILFVSLKKQKNNKIKLPKYISSSSIFCWLASVAIAAIALHNWINEGGGKIATLNGVRLNISPDNIQDTNHLLPVKIQKWKILDWFSSLYVFISNVNVL